MQNSLPIPVSCDVTDGRDSIPEGNLLKGLISLSENNSPDALTRRFPDESRVARPLVGP